MKFRATIELGGKTATGIEGPATVVEKLDAGKRVKVLATIRSHTYRSSVAPMGGRFMLPVSAEVREAAGVAAGDVVEVNLELDTAPRVGGGAARSRGRTQARQEGEDVLRRAVL